MAKKKVRKFKVWFDCGHAGTTPREIVVKFMDDESAEDIDEACSEYLQDLINNHYYSGWEEIEDG